MTTVEAMQWNDGRGSFGAQLNRAADVIEWVNDLGGEARYEPHVTSNPYDENDPGEPRIAVRTVNGWAYAAPGATIRATKQCLELPAMGPRGRTEKRVLAFEVVTGDA